MRKTGAMRCTKRPLSLMRGHGANTTLHRCGADVLQRKGTDYAVGLSRFCGYWAQLLPALVLIKRLTQQMCVRWRMIPMGSVLNLSRSEYSMTWLPVEPSPDATTPFANDSKNESFDRKDALCGTR